MKDWSERVLKVIKRIFFSSYNSECNCIVCSFVFVIKFTLTKPFSELVEYIAKANPSLRYTMIYKNFL